LDWNIERGLQFESIKQTIALEGPDLCLLQEVDLHARRTAERNLAEDLARANSLNYVFGIEFQELGEGTPTTPAYHGQATLSRLPIRSHRVLRFLKQTEFWKPRRLVPNLAVFQRRLGGRMALITELEWGERLLVVYNVHLESRIPADGRLRQLEELLEDMQAYPPHTPIVLAGDFNARSQPQGLAKGLEDAGFRAAVTTSEPTVSPEDSAVSSWSESAYSFVTGAEPRGDHRSIDWVFVRGPLDFARGRVHADVQASDHYPVSAEISLIATQP
jgi:endonuclease/exonuclease/phosphatase family metal-dependent hydrolase